MQLGRLAPGVAAQQASATAGVLGASVTTNNALGAVQDVGQILNTPVFSTTMRLESVLANGNRGLWFQLRNC